MHPAILGRARAVARWALLLVLAVGALSRPSAAQAPAWAYVTAFRSGFVYVIDTAAEHLVRAIVVQDAEGVAGVCVSSDGRRVVIVDGGVRSRLRVLDGVSGNVVAETRFVGRRLVIDGISPVVMTSDNRWVLVDARDGVLAFDLRAGRFLPRPLSIARDARVVGGGGASILAVADGIGLLFAAPYAPRHQSWVRARVNLGLNAVADAAGARDGSCLFAVSPVPPMRRLPPPRAPKRGSATAPPPRAVASAPPSAASPSPSVPPERTPRTRSSSSPRPASSPTPNPSLREGAWNMAVWRAGEPVARVVDLVRRVDLEKISASMLPRLAVSPDGRWVGLVYARRAWILHADTLAVQWEMYPPGVANGAAFTPDGSELLTVLDQSLYCIRLANRAGRMVLRGQMRLPGAALVVASVRPTSSEP